MEVGLPPPVTRLLVMPFDTRGRPALSREMGIELADEIADSLSHVERLQISGRTSADSLAAAHTDAVEAGQKLGVDAVVNGEVAEETGGLRATIRLTAVKDAECSGPGSTSVNRRTYLPPRAALRRRSLRN